MDLAALPRVGLGSVCRRQSTAEIAAIVTVLSSQGIRLHGFGVKTAGLRLYGDRLASLELRELHHLCDRLAAPRPVPVRHRPQPALFDLPSAHSACHQEDV